MIDYVAHTAPCFDGREIEAASELIASRMVNEGELCRKLVARVAGLANGLGGVVTSCGTLGLHLALKVLNVETARDEVVIPDVACRSLYDCVRMAGGTPLFCDINLQDFSLAIESVKAHLTESTRAIILPHMYGCPADVDGFSSLGVPVIQDCAHSLGATYHGLPLGAFGCLSCFSLEGSKLIAAGEGGVVIANEEASLSRLNGLRYGLDGGFAYPYRLSDLVASVALVQLDKLPSMISKRRGVADLYRCRLEALEGRGILTLPRPLAGRESVYYRFVILCEDESEDLIEFANRRGVLIRNPLPSGCLSETFGNRVVENPNSRRFIAHAASLPIYPDLTIDHIDRVVDTIYSFFN